MATRLHRGVVLLDPSMVADCLQLPPGTTIIDARIDHWSGGTLSLLVDHPDLPEVADGEHPPRVTFKATSSWRV